MASACTMLQRSISTSSVCQGKRNFRKFLLYNKRGTREFKEQQMTNPDPQIPIDHRGVRPIGFEKHGRFSIIPEMVPEIVVPSLEGFNLKPYVAYHSNEIRQSEFTPEDLFNVVYAKKIVEDFKNNQLAADGSPLNPSEAEKLTPKEAKASASRTGCDLFGD